MSWRIFYHQRHATRCGFSWAVAHSGQEALKAINFPRFKTLLLSHLLHRQRNGKVMSSSLTLRGSLRPLPSFGSG